MKLMSKYILILDFVKGCLFVHSNNGGTPKDYGFKEGHYVYNFSDELPIIDESHLNDIKNPYKYLFIFNFSKNKGLIIPLTEEKYNSMNEEYIDDIALDNGIFLDYEWICVNEDEIYYNEQL